MKEKQLPNPDDYVEIQIRLLPNGKMITYCCRKEGPSSDDVMEKVYRIAADSLRRKTGLR